MFNISFPLHDSCIFPLSPFTNHFVYILFLLNFYKTKLLVLLKRILYQLQGEVSILKTCLKGQIKWTIK
ncbi:hypothetical protein CFP56_023006 [Quercus suber]|uniref:Uncharacterized protein n=1 Tax=Quercus suber TaxID=58331 RepID=A0AAW0KBS9_QUESU